MTGYVRKDTTNNIADGNVINAADLDAEFDGVQDAFNASTGHNHDGTSGEGAPITALGPTQDVTISAILLAPKTTNTVDIGSSSLRYKDLFLAGNGSIGGTLAVTGVATLTAQPILSSLTASRAVFTDGSKGLVSNAITGTGNVVMSASPTLTGTIDAAAATLSGNLTLSGGTANGVTYLNGSKVVTSGSALTFDGTNLALTGTSPIYKVPTAGGSLFDAGGNNGIYILGSSNYVATFAAGSEGMRLTSTGLGIGTSSPAAYAKLTVSGTAGVQTGASQQIVINAPTTTAGQGAGIRFNAASGANEAVGVIGLINEASGNSGAMTFHVYNAGANIPEYMRLSSLGNLGIGTDAPATKLVLAASDASTTGQLRFARSQDVSYFWEIGRDNNLTGDFIFSNASGGAKTERMRLNASGNLGIGTSSPTNPLTIYSSSAQVAIQNATTGAGASDGSRFQLSGSDLLIVNREAASIQLYTNDTERMRLDSSGNLGIGTTSPVSKIDARAASATMGNYQTIQAFSTDATAINLGGGISLGGNYSGSSTFAQFASIAGRKENGTDGNYAGYLQFGTNSQATGVREVMRLDSSGNLGLGVTPSAWTTLTAFQNKNSSWYGSGNEGGIYANAYYASGSWRYIATAAATGYDFNATAGQHRWFNAPSGTAGNAITFTQAMTLDASGTLLIGQTSAGAGARLEITGVSSAGEVASFTGTSALGTLQIFNQPGVSNRRWGIPAGSDAFIWTGFNSGAYLEQMRLDGSGNLLVGRANTMSGNGNDGKVGVQISPSPSNIVVQNSSDNNIYLAKVSGYSNSTFIQFANNGTTVGSVTTNGTNTTYATSSDYRLKNTIAPMTGALAKVAQLKPCTYKWNIDGSSGEGFIAHELAEVCPDAVVGEKDAVDAEGKPQYQGIDVSFLVATLTAALQELNAKFDAYVASHP